MLANISKVPPSVHKLFYDASTRDIFSLDLTIYIYHTSNPQHTKPEGDTIKIVNYESTSRKKVKYFVRFFARGFKFDVGWSVERANADEPIKLDENAYGYQCYEKDCIVDGKLEHLVGKAKNLGPMHYAGTVYTLEEVKEQFPKLDTLIGDMESNQYRKVVKTPQGNWKPFEDGDVLIES
jgi:hypothetical protein